jgi:hypothetical protein
MWVEGSFCPEGGDRVRAVGSNCVPFCVNGLSTGAAAACGFARIAGGTAACGFGVRHRAARGGLLGDSFGDPGARRD